MIDLNDINENLNNDIVSDFEIYLSELYKEKEILKAKFLSIKIAPLIVNPTTGDTSKFIVQFLPYLDFIMFFSNDAEVNIKLVELGFKKDLLKWFIDISELEFEIRRLMQIKGFIFNPYNFLFASIQHLRINFKLEFIESFGLSVLYNNSETNIIHVDFSKRLKRRNYKNGNNLRASKSEYEFLMNKKLDLIEGAIIESGGEKKDIRYVLYALNGNTKIFLDLFQFRTIDISNNMAYCELFPLIKMICKEKNLLDETDFYSNNNDKSFDANYRNYKYRKVQKILLKK